MIHVEFGNGSITVKVLMTAESVRKENAADMYEVLE